MHVLRSILSQHATLIRLLIFIAFLCPPVSRSASAQDAAAAIEKANLYIEVVKDTERAVDSWDRYTSWVNMKTGPTGKERYISYGMYDLNDVDDLLKKANAAASVEPRDEPLDAGMVRYIAAYEALAPIMNEAAGYYDREVYTVDKLAKGKAYHKQMVPLATAFLALREQVLPLLRARILEVQALEVKSQKERDATSAATLTANVMLAINRVMDTFPRQRPQQIAGDEMERMMAELGPDTPGEKFDQIIAGVKPALDAKIDAAKFNAALESYQKAVSDFDNFSGEKPEDFDKFKPLPGEMLAFLRAFQEPLEKSGGKEFEGAGPIVGRITEQYYAMLNESQTVWSSQLRQLP
jgi:hypothetical protein